MNKTGLVPLNGCVLVELAQTYKNVVTPDERYKTNTSGVVIAQDANINDSYVGKTVFWEEYKDAVRLKIDDKEYAFIKFEDIRGYRDAA
jgi:co-chaperonin GroES (HSP10)